MFDELLSLFGPHIFLKILELNEMGVGKIIAVAMFLALLGLGCAGSVQAGNLSAKQIKSMFPGTFKAVWKNKYTVIVKATADGKLDGRNQSGQTDKGKWWLAGNGQFCVSFRWWTLGKPKCGFLTGSGRSFSGFFRKSNGKPKIFITKL